MAENQEFPEPFETFVASNATISFIHYHWIDFCGILNTQILTKRHASKLAKSNVPLHVGPGAMLGPAGLTSFAETFNPGGSCCLFPDWSSLRHLSPRHASVVCSISEELTNHPGLHDLLSSDPYLRCPRQRLKRLVETFGAEYPKTTFLLGFELEFHLLTEGQIQGKEGIPQVGCNHWNTASSMRGPMSSCVEACVVALEAAGIAVEKFHAESGAQQFEIATEPLPATDAVDALIQSQELVKIVAEERGYRATFLPVLPKLLLPEQQHLGVSPPLSSSSGMHAHLSIHRRRDCTDGRKGNRNQEVGKAEEEEEGETCDISLDKISSSFLAGILRHLPGLYAVGMPGANSFARIEPARLGRWVAWGTRNRFTPIRAIPSPGHHHHRRWELRAVDACANMHLAVAAYIAAGLVGVRAGSSLQQRDYRGFLHRLDERERDELGIVERTPGSFEEAKARWVEYCSDDSSSGLRELLGKELLALYFDVKEKEILYMSKLGEAEKAAFLLKNY